MAKRAPTLTHEQAIFAYALLGGLPAVIFTVIWLWSSDHATDMRATVLLLVLSCWVGFATAAKERVIRPLQTMSNLLLALREGDFSFRARGAERSDPLGDVLAEINGLGDILQTQRRGAMEATALLTTVIKEIDVAIFAFDSEQVLRLVNPAGQKLLGEPSERLLGRDATSIGLAESLEGEPNRMLKPAAFPKSHGRWGMRRTTFREDGRPHQLVVFGDLSRPLREEQLRAWQRLVRVLGHELNNSLAPIKSIATTLGSSMERKPRPDDWESDMQSGLGVIASRAESLERFLQGYSKLARLPPPQMASCDLNALLKRAVALERRLGVEVRPGPAIELMVDSAQIEQAVINLVKNAVEATLEQKAEKVRISWRRSGGSIEIWVEDSGAGIEETSNLFVPFFTTKPEGSGIGLVLCQQIAENHGGSLALYNRDDRSGCIAIMRLPLPK
ncbi:MAG TPA: ATP-binding protein [Opitutaceae bacterium]|jgi:PAS domain S-box-containing protein|nr:ATP-binding protein [Opitutaceae bacterium]